MDITNIILSLKEGLTELEFAEMMGRMFHYLGDKFAEDFKRQKLALEYRVKLIKSLVKELGSEIEKGMDATKIKKEIEA